MCVRIKKQVETKLSQVPRIGADDVHYLELLSYQLRGALWEEMYEPHVVRCAFFYVC